MKREMSFKDALALAEHIIARFEKIEGKPWGAEGSMIELQKQVGDLAKLVMVQEQYYFPDRDAVNKQYAVSKEKIADELADILFCVISLAKHYNIDLEEAHIAARKEEDEFLKSRGV
jgi:uncharacterized protein YabN with tetrapyrrole methylase and pyrophosphatase domain